MASGSVVVPYEASSSSVSLLPTGKTSLVSSEVPRTSSLVAPIMLLEGHQEEIFCAKFHPNGQTLASAGFERTIYLWNVYGDCENYAVLRGHKGAVLELHFANQGATIVTCSTDKTLACWDTETGTKVKSMKGHSTFVNTCCPARRGPQLIVSGSDDSTVKLWDQRRKGAIQTFQNTFQTTAVCFDDQTSQVFSGGIDNNIKVWDLRKNALLYTLQGHVDSITGLALSPDGSFLLSNSMDNSVRVWDIRPYAPAERCLKIFMGHQHNFEKNLLRCSWSPDGRMISSGSADRFLYIWDTVSIRLQYKLPGHEGSINETAFHSKEPIVLSCGSDKKIFLGEL